MTCPECSVAQAERAALRQVFDGFDLAAARRYYENEEGTYVLACYYLGVTLDALDAARAALSAAPPAVPPAPPEPHVPKHFKGDCPACDVWLAERETPAKEETT